MFIKTHSVRQSQPDANSDVVASLMKTANKSGIEINDLAQRSHIRESRVLPDPAHFTDYDPLQHMNEIEKEEIDEKLEKVDLIDVIQDNIKNIQLELARIRDESVTIINENAIETNQMVQGRVNDFDAQLKEVQLRVNQVMVRSDQLQEREQLRDNILQVHDQALTNYTKIIQRLEQRLNGLEANMLQKDEVDQRLKNLEYDIKQLFDQMQGRFSEVQQESNQNVNNIMSIMNVFEQKQKGIVMQLDQLRLLFGK